MQPYAQYGEESVLLEFFNNKKNGFLVDIGAVDGILYSNTRHLIESYDWTGILVEPHPVFFDSLKSLYRDNSKIKLLNVGCFNVETEVDFFIYSQGNESCVSTMSEEFKKRVMAIHGDKFLPDPIKIKTITLNSILNNNFVDFLSIDVEGVDMQVLSSNDWNKNRPSLICIEHSMDNNILINFMFNINYIQYTKTAGNTFFTDNRL